MNLKFTREEKSWIMYDVANSAYSLVVVTAILPIYFKAVATNAGVSSHLSTSYWGYATSFGTLIISLLAPILGTLADYKGYKKILFSFFALCGIFMTFALAVVPDHSWLILLIVYVISHMGFQGANIFYDGFLIDVTDDKRMDVVSSAGFGYGYIGSALLFVIVMVLQITNGFGLMTTVLVTRLSFVLTAVWWGLFTYPILKNVNQKNGIVPDKHPVKISLQRLIATLKEIKQYKHVMFFLIAYFFYIDGVDTIISMASSFGVDIGINSNHLIIILLIINIVAFPFTILYGRLSQRYGTKTMILVAIGVYTIICIYALFMKNVIDFFILGFLVGTSQGGIQALSRSYYARLIPKDKANEFFGFYNIFGKFSAIIGPVIFGVMTQLTGKSQYGIVSLVVLFIIGGVLFYFTSEEPFEELT